MIPKYIVGMDPGKTGSVTILPTFNTKRIYSLDLNKHSVYGLFQELMDLGDSVDFFLENPGYMPKMSCKSLGMAKLARSVGELDAIVQCLGRTPNYIQPRVWKKCLQFPTGAEKSLSKELANHLYGKFIRVTNLNADAILIAHYGLNLYGKGTRFPRLPWMVKSA